MSNKQVTFYLTYGYQYQKDKDWIIPLRIWVRDKSDVIRRLAAKGARKIIRKKAGLERLTDVQKRLFMSRAEGFIADSESNQKITFAFDHDPDHDTFQLRSIEGRSKTDRNGLLEGFLTLPHDKAQRLLQAQGSTQGWLTYRAVSKHHDGVGRVRLLEAGGLSVISDIDDTLKVTGITAGEQVVLRNTFFREFVIAPGMAEMYQAFEPAVAFHYISGAPWQLYEPLSQFLFSNSVRFPSGSFHMKNVRTNPFESETYHDFWNLLVNGSKRTTIVQKLRQISAVITHFPQRKFILIGDSGEADPEVFQAIQDRYGEQVQDI